MAERSNSKREISGSILELSTRTHRVGTSYSIMARLGVRIDVLQYLMLFYSCWWQHDITDTTMISQYDITAYDSIVGAVISPLSLISCFTM